MKEIRLKIKTWKDLEKQYGLTDITPDVINCKGYFSKELEREMPKDRILTVKKDKNQYDWNGWKISEEVIEEINPKQIIVKKIMDEMNIATGFTVWKEKVEINRNKAYRSEHSMIRAVMFKIKMYAIPSFVAMHLRTHSATGQLHFISTCREDRGFKGVADRNTPVNHMMILNAQHLIDISRKRLCTKSHEETQKTWMDICNQIKELEPELGKYLVPNCIYRGECPEFKSCGFFKEIINHG